MKSKQKLIAENAELRKQNKALKDQYKQAQRVFHKLGSDYFRLCWYVLKKEEEEREYLNEMARMYDY